MKVGMGDVEDGDVFSISVINDCTGNGDDAVVDSAVIVDMGDGDNVAVVDVCAISVGTRVIDDDVGDDISVIDVDMSVFDDDDVADVFVINEDMGEGDDVGECDKSVVVVAVVQASAWIWVKKKCYIQNKGCMVQAADPTIYSLTKIIKTKTNCKTKTCKIGEKKGGMVA